MERLRALDVVILTGTALEQVGEREVVVCRGDERTTLPADTVVLAHGYRPNDELARQLRPLGLSLCVTGDAAECRTAREAVREGAEVGRRIG